MARNRSWLQWLNPFTRLQRGFTIFAVVWFVAALYMLYRAFSGVQMPATMAIYLLGTVVCSLLAFVFYGVDKRRAVRDRPRISERTLHLFSVFGGWPGAHVARMVFHHKTQKVSFRIVFWMIVVLHLILIGYCMFFGWWEDAFRAYFTSRAAT